MLLIGGFLLAVLLIFVGFTALMTVLTYVVFKALFIGAIFAGAMLGHALFDSGWGAILGGALGLVGLLGVLALIGREKSPES